MCSLYDERLLNHRPRQSATSSAHRRVIDLRGKNIRDRAVVAFMCTEKVKSDCGCGRASGKEHRLCMTALQWDLGFRIYSHILTYRFFFFAATASCYSSVGWLEDTGCSSCHTEIKYLTPLEFYHKLSDSGCP